MSIAGGVPPPEAPSYPGYSPQLPPGQGPPPPQGPYPNSGQYRIGFSCSSRHQSLSLITLVSLSFQLLLPIHSNLVRRLLQLLKYLHQATQSLVEKSSSTHFSSLQLREMCSCLCGAHFVNEKNFIIFWCQHFVLLLNCLRIIPDQIDCIFFNNSLSFHVFVLNCVELLVAHDACHEAFHYWRRWSDRG